MVYLEMIEGQALLSLPRINSQLETWAKHCPRVRTRIPMDWFTFLQELVCIRTLLVGQEILQLEAFLP